MIRQKLLTAILAVSFLLPLSGEAAMYVSDAEEQVRLIASERMVWDIAVPSIETVGYTVTDIDHNGRLEIWVSEMGGTGTYTYTNVYEVNERKDGLVPCGLPWKNGESEPDVMIREWVLSFANGMDGKEWYVFEDVGKEGHLPRESYWALSLDNGLLHTRYLGKRGFYFDREGNLYSSCYNKDGDNVPNIQYELIGSEAFPYSEPKWVHMAWLKVFRWDWQEWEEKNEDSVYFMLLDTYMNFTGEKEGFG